MVNMKLEVKDLVFGYDKDKVVLNDVNFTGDTGELVCMLGPNGVGKSTLFSCLLNTNTKYKGNIYIDGEDIKSFTIKELATKVAFVPQMHFPTFNYSVIEVVMMGLSSTIGTFSSPSKEHEKKAMEALKMLSMERYANRGYMNISGGERQLVLIARALVQNTKILLLDEPTASLDFGNQAKVLLELKKLAEQGYFILFSSHQPDHAYWYADNVLALLGGKVHAYGKPQDVLTSEILSDMYDIPVDVANFQYHGKTRHSCIPGEII